MPHGAYLLFKPKPKPQPKRVELNPKKVKKQILDFAEFAPRLAGKFELDRTEKRTIDKIVARAKNNVEHVGEDYSDIAKPLKTVVKTLEKYVKPKSSHSKKLQSFKTIFDAVTRPPVRLHPVLLDSCRSEAVATQRDGFTSLLSVR